MTTEPEARDAAAEPPPAEAEAPQPKSDTMRLVEALSGLAAALADAKAADPLPEPEPEFALPHADGLAAAIAALDAPVDALPHPLDLPYAEPEDERALADTPVAADDEEPEPIVAVVEEDGAIVATQPGGEPLLDATDALPNPLLPILPEGRPEGEAVGAAQPRALASGSARYPCGCILRGSHRSNAGEGAGGRCRRGGRRDARGADGGGDGSRPTPRAPARSPRARGCHAAAARLPPLARRRLLSPRPLRAGAGPVPSGPPRPRRRETPERLAMPQSRRRCEHASQFGDAVEPVGYDARDANWPIDPRRNVWRRWSRRW